MKQTLLFSFALIVTLATYAQNATLTKGETLEYIQKKFREFEGTYVVTIDTTRRTTNIDDKMLTGAYVSLTDQKITFSYNLSFRPFQVGGNPPCFCSYTITFKPADITYMNYSNKYQNLYISLANKTAKQVVRCCQYYKTSERDNIDNYVVLHISGDEDAINKIMKALNHLKALLKAEDDPFGN
jgi:hypothetical protein